MADFAIALRGRVVAAPSVSAVLGTRLYPRDKVPQNAPKPYGYYQVISDPRPEHLKGYDGARQSRMQVDIIADDYASARAIGETIIAAIANPGIFGGIRFGRTKAEGPRDLSEETASGTISRASLDLLTEHAPA